MEEADSLVRLHRSQEEKLLQALLYLAGFAVICLASHRIGEWFSRLRLPYITGYLFTGVLVGSFGLQLLPSNIGDSLRFIDQIALAVIAFVAGSELFYKDLVNRLRSILWSLGLIIVVALSLIGGSLFWLLDLIPFTQGLTIGDKIAVALLGGTILLALSPPSTIAVIKELRARGPATRLILGITIAMDVAIIVIFAISSSFAVALVEQRGVNLVFLALLLLDLVLSGVLGVATGWLLQQVLGQRWSRWLKLALIIALGYAIFAGAAWLKVFSAANWPIKLVIEPLLVALIGGFLITNFSPYRDEFAELLHDIGPVVYVAFFTITGLGLKLDILLTALIFAAVLFVVRALALWLGSNVGLWLAGEPVRFRRLLWLGLITQAGIALGLAREASLLLPGLGEAFATLIIAVIVLNEIAGPLTLRFALQRLGEANLPEPGIREDVRDVLILGIEQQSIALARQLSSRGWRVRVADTDLDHVRRLAAEDVDERHIPEVSLETLRSLIDHSTDAVVALLSNDEDNLRACQIALEKFGVPRLIVRLNRQDLREEFRELGAIIVDPATAMVNLLEQAVRAPQSLSLLLHTDPVYDVVQMTVTNRDVDGRLVRDLRLPADVLLLEISRDGQAIVPHGYTRLRWGDEITVVGKPESLREVSLRIG
ncbi:monovalent cation:proton antiporter family protein [Chloroflexus sp.]|uniref:monovalent cation:proton antiporter family protein n=1 Tax=Chloroflexus sp. TaxID=1904827 RepID=UPI00258B0E40|nr:cation:proton antiporter [Chloroflexus sp.]